MPAFCTQDHLTPHFAFSDRTAFSSTNIMTNGNKEEDWLFYCIVLGTFSCLYPWVSYSLFGKKQVNIFDDKQLFAFDILVYNAMPSVWLFYARFVFNIVHIACGIFTACQRSSRKVMFSVMCMCLSVHRESHMVITHNAFYLTVQAPCLYSALVPLLVTSGSQYLFKLAHLSTTLAPVMISGGWLRRHVRWVSGRCALYRNTFLLFKMHSCVLWSTLWEHCKMGFLSVLGTWSVLHCIDVSTGGDLDYDKCCNTSPTVHVAETDKGCALNPEYHPCHVKTHQNLSKNITVSVA